MNRSGEAQRFEVVSLSSPPGYRKRSVARSLVREQVESS